MAHLSSLYFRRHTSPKGSTLPTSLVALHDKDSFLLTVCFYHFRHLGFNGTDPRPGFSACPDFAVHRCRLLWTPPSSWFSGMLACAYFSLATIGPARSTTWRPPNHRELVYCFRYTRMPFRIYHCRSGRLLSFRLPDRGDTVPPRVRGVCFPYLCHHRFRSPPFVQATKPWRFSIFWVRSACIPFYHRRFCPFPFRLSKRGIIVILVVFVLY